MFYFSFLRCSIFLSVIFFKICAYISGLVCFFVGDWGHGNDALAKESSAHNLGLLRGRGVSLGVGRISLKWLHGVFSLLPLRTASALLNLMLAKLMLAKVFASGFSQYDATDCNCFLLIRTHFKSQTETVLERRPTSKQSQYDGFTLPADQIQHPLSKDGALDI